MQTFQHHKSFATSQRMRPEIIDKQIYEELSQAEKLPMQGRLLDNTYADYLLSQNIFKNYKLSDNLVQSWYKARHNVIPCNYTLSIWYPQQSQSLNGCTEFKNNYSTRQNALVEKIASELPHVMAADKTVGSTFKELGLSSSQHPELHLKPNIVLRPENEVTIIDVACPYDLYIENLYQVKLNKYYCIRDLLQQNGLKCAIDAIIIGSLGTVHKKTLNVLLKAGMNKRQEKCLVKWCST